MSSAAEIFGTALRRIRVQRGITQKQLGTMTGMSHTFIGQMERGLKAPNLNAIVAFAAALNARVDELLSDFSPAPPNSRARNIDDRSPAPQRRCSSIHDADRRASPQT